MVFPPTSTAHDTDNTLEPWPKYPPPFDGDCTQLAYSAPGVLEESLGDLSLDHPWDEGCTGTTVGTCEDSWGFGTREEMELDIANSWVSDAGFDEIEEKKESVKEVVVKKEKPRRGRKRRYTPEQELEIFGPDAFTDLKGTTAAHSRKMTPKQREIMLHKRRLRNRESAQRSREKRSKTIGDLSKEYEQLHDTTVKLKEMYNKLMKEHLDLKDEMRELKEENNYLKVKNSIRGANDEGMTELRLARTLDSEMTEVVTP